MLYSSGHPKPRHPSPRERFVTYYPLRLSGEVRRAFDQARESLVADEALIDLIRDLKTQSDGRLRIFAMSNISPPDWAVLRTKPADLAFTSTSSRARELAPVRRFLLTTNWRM